MKKSKLLTFLAASVLAVTLTSCFETSYKDGVAVTFKDANGVRTDYTTAELFADYQSGSSTASTDFTKVKEILIRRYFETVKSGDLATLKVTAQNKVDGIKAQAEKNATSNGTAYATELESLLSGEGVDNIDELFEKKLYDAELEKFETDYKSGDNLVYMRDGVTSDGTTAFFPESSEFGIGSKGYIKTRAPYNVSHILLEVSSSEETDATSATITESETKTLADVVLQMAGANTTLNDDGYPVSTSMRTTFGQLAKTYSKDTGSGENYGNLGIMDTTSSYVQGFQYGVYAYDTIYTASSATQFKKDNESAVKWSSEATYRNVNGEEVSLDEATKAGAVLSEIGTIPFGAIVALANEDVQKNFPKQTFYPNDGNTAYYPRNVIWNKYFNSHRIAVITPNDIDYAQALRGDIKTASTSYVHADGTYDMDAERGNWSGTYSSSYASLPGFQVNTQGLLPNVGSNVLTNEKGQIILAVRGDSGTKGIHFICIDRSALSEYGAYVDNDGSIAEYTASDYSAHKGDEDITSLSEYYTFKNPVTDESSFPSYTVDGTTKQKTTLVTMGLDTTKVNYQENIDTLKSKVSGYNADLDTYELQYLVEQTGATFNTGNALVKQIYENVTNYSKQKRQKTADEAQKSIDSSWTKYAEFLTREDISRGLNEDGSQKLISEAAAILYCTTDAQKGEGAWGHGGACYMKK